MGSDGVGLSVHGLNTGIAQANAASNIVDSDQSVKKSLRKIARGNRTRNGCGECWEFQAEKTKNPSCGMAGLDLTSVLVFVTWDEILT